MDISGRLDLPYASRKSGSGPPPLQNPAHARLLLTLRFKSIPNPDKQKRPAFKLTVSVSGRLDLNQRLQVPQTCTLNPCATARCCVFGRTSRKIAQQGSLVNKAFFQQGHRTIISFRRYPKYRLRLSFIVFQSDNRHSKASRLSYEGFPMPFSYPFTISTTLSQKGVGTPTLFPCVHMLPFMASISHFFPFL